MTTADKLRRLMVLETAADKQQSLATSPVYKLFREGELVPESSVPVYNLVTSKTQQ